MKTQNIELENKVVELAMLAMDKGLLTGFQSKPSKFASDGLCIFLNVKGERFPKYFSISKEIELAYNYLTKIVN